MLDLLNLPRELLARTFFFANRSSLKSLRQTCRFTSQLSADRLYRTVHLKPDEASQRGIREILNSPSLQRIPRKIYVNTVEDGYNYQDQEEQTWPEGWNEILPRLKTFTRLNSAVLCFHEDFSSDNPEDVHWQDYPQSPQFRSRAMGTFFSLLESLQSPIQDLGIRNLQADNPKDRTTLANIEKTLSGLKSLRLSIVNETNEAAPEHDLERPEIRQFFKDLPNTWLNPPASSLQHLSLYTRDYHGFYPHLDLSNLYYPHLKTLSLGNFCFFQDSQIDWILKHADTLEEIYLDDCAILYDFGMMDENMDQSPVPQSALVRRPGDEITLYGSYGKRWHEIFDLFAEKLPKLRHFRIGSTDWFDGVPFEQENNIKVGLYRNRYMTCYDGYGPSAYMEGEDKDKLSHPEDDEWRSRPQCDDEDQAALQRLLTKLGQSADQKHSMELYSPIENPAEKEY